MAAYDVSSIIKKLYTPTGSIHIAIAVNQETIIMCCVYRGTAEKQPLADAVIPVEIATAIAGVN